MAMEISGTEYSAEALMKEIEKEIVFMDRSEGGVTFCGGEPLLHPGPLLDLLRSCGERGYDAVRPAGDRTRRDG